MSLTIDTRPRGFGVSSILLAFGFVFDLMKHLTAREMRAS